MRSASKIKTSELLETFKLINKQHFSKPHLIPKINENNTNTTRFGVFSRIPRGESVGDEHFILLFTVRDEAGSLCKAVSVFSELGYNLKALKSRPSKDVIWNYYFFLEGEGKLNKESEKKMLSELSKVCTNVRLVGRYGKEQII